MVAIYLPKVPMVLPRRRTRLPARTVAVSSAVGMAVIGSVATAVVAIQRRVLRRRELRYRVANAARRAIHFSLRRSIAAAERVRDRLPR
jgi:hypothetical protein